MTDVKFVKFGGDVDFNGGAFGAGLAASMQRNSLTADPSTYGQIIRVQPRFFYNAIPAHLRIQLDAGFYFFSFSEGGEDPESDMAWAVQPQLFWNFLGSGATDGLGTGMLFRYRVASTADEDFIWDTVEFNPWQSTNMLDIIFKWSM
jgi:hypothetical protein